jgi:hypothetical protein
MQKKQVPPHSSTATINTQESSLANAVEFALLLLYHKKQHIDSV